MPEEEAGEKEVDGRWRIDLLGGLRAVQGDRAITRFRTQKTGLLLAYLAYHRHRVHRREELIELLWPERDPAAGRDSLSTALVWLRRALQPRQVESSEWRVPSRDRVPPEGRVMGAENRARAAPLPSPSLRGVPGRGSELSTVIVADRTSVQLNPAAVTTDAAAFKAALRSAARATSSGERGELLAQAVERYRGELLPGFQDDWVLQERQWLAELYFQALGHLLSHLQAQGELERALEYAHRGVRADPLREEIHRELIRLYAALGQHPAALRQYDELERLLKKDLGAAPSAATRRLLSEINHLAVISHAAPDVALRSAPSPHAVGEGTGFRPPGISLSPPPPRPVSGQEGENRLVTVLFADMSDSVQATTNLIPEEAAALMSRLLTVMVDVVLKYEGRIDRFLGDGLLALFGVPQAHEDDPERAVRAAMEIREAARHLGLEVTAGINTGAVYVGPIGSEKHQETTAVGPAVNLASRLQGQAEPGQILVGAATYRQTRRAFEHAPLSVSVKGQARPVRAYTVERAVPRPQKTRGIEGLRAALIGRDEELARLRAALSELLRGNGQMVTLIGEAGIGKSRLVAELKQVTVEPSRDREGAWPCPSLPHGRGSELLWLEGRCLELTMGTGYSLFTDLFRDYLAGDEDEPARARRLVGCLQELTAEGHLSREQVDEIGPLLGNLLSVRFGTDWDQRLQHAGPEQLRHQTLRAVRDFFVALARRQPLVLILEDLHWADSLSLELLALLVEALPLAPLMLLCVYRPEHQQRGSHLGSIAAEKCAGRHTEIVLHELSPNQSRRLVEALLSGAPPHRPGPGTRARVGSGLPAGVKALILEKARGNPFFIEELVRHLTEAGLAAQEAGDAAGAGEPRLGRGADSGGGRAPGVPSAGVGRAWGHVSSLAVPDTIQSVILSRVDRLRPDLQQLLQLASIFGRLFRRRLLEKMVESGEWLGMGGEGAGGPRSTPHPALRTALCELEEEALIYQERAMPDEEYSFQHVLTQETIYGTLLQRQRAALHQQAAEAIEAVYPESLDVYYEQLAHHYDRSEADDKAVEYLVKAGEKAAWRAYLKETARDYFQRALDRLDAQQSKRPDPGAGPGPRCGPPARNPKSTMEWRLAALTGLAGVYFLFNRHSEAEARWREAIALGHEIGSSPEALARLYSRLCGNLWFLRRRGDELLRVAQEGLRVVGEDTQSVGAVMMLDACMIYPQRVEQLLRNLPYSEELGPPYDHTIERLLGENRLDEAEQWLERWEREARQCHDLPGEGGIHNIRRQLLIKRGDLHQALVENQKALEIFTKIGNETLRRLQLRILPETRSLIAYQERDVEALREITAAMLPDQVASVVLNLGRLEELSANAGEFRAFCERLRRERPDLSSALAQWYLEPAAPRPCHRLFFEDLFSADLAPDWEWLDPPGDAALSTGKGLEIEAPAGRGLWGPQLTAPRLLRWTSGDFAVETVCTPASPEKPPVGGLLLWKDAGYFLRFERGLRSTHEIGIERFVEGQHTIAGRGRLPSAAVHLRLERRGQDVRALCSADGRAWFRVAQVAFPVKDPVQVGLYALGMRHGFGTGPTRTAMRFKSFRMWQLKSSNGEGAL